MDATEADESSRLCSARSYNRRAAARCPSWSSVRPSSMRARADACAPAPSTRRRCGARAWAEPSKDEGTTRLRVHHVAAEVLDATEQRAGRRIEPGGQRRIEPGLVDALGRRGD